MHIQLKLMSSIHLCARYEYQIYMYIKYPVMSVHVRRKYQSASAQLLTVALVPGERHLSRKGKDYIVLVHVMCSRRKVSNREREHSSLVESRKSRLNMPVEKEKAGVQ
jgi:hypothetical protein